jgi:hypothetical protein
MRSEYNRDALSPGSFPTSFRLGIPKGNTGQRTNQLCINRLPNRSQLVRNSINRSAWRRGLIPGALVLVTALLALSPQAGAVCEEGCGNNGNTFLGEGALSNNNTAPRIRPRVVLRFLTTLRAATTQPPGLTRSVATPPAATTRRSGLVRLHATPLRTATRLQDLTRSGETRPATGTRPLAMLRSLAT